jgi:NADH:ubiquinone oxidoreductase subunit K
MRLYSESSEETLRARKLLTEWVGEGLLSKAQYQLLEKETVSDLRTTNIFLRLVLFLFTLISVGAAVGLFFVVFVSHSSEKTDGVILMIFAAVCYAAAEVAVSQARLYRYGIEEALAVCSVGFLCVGMLLAFFGGGLFWSKPDAAQFLVPAAGAVFSLWIWRRFGLDYAFLAAMIFVVFLPDHWTSSREAQHLIVAAFYATGLGVVATARSRHRFDYLEEAYSLVEAFLWLGIYLAINLQLSSLNLRDHWWDGTRAALEFSQPFYWGTWVLTWCLPPIVLARGIRQKDRPIIAVGAIIAVLTFVCNKPYLDWHRHTWDPILLGILLTSSAVFIRRWLARGPGGIRHGFTALRMSEKDKQLINVGSAGLGLLSPTPTPQPSSPDFHFGGGHSGGGGASSDF